MSFGVNSEGQLVRLVEQEVDENEVEAQLQEELDAAQNDANTHNANVSNSQEAVQAAQEQLDAAELQLEAHKADAEAALARLQKSEADRASLAAARELRNAQPQPADEGSDDSDADGAEDDGAESAAVDVPVNVQSAAG